MAATENVWANPGGTPGMPICKIERGSEAWQHLQEAFNDADAAYVRISATHGELKVKIDEEIWTWALDVERER
jgi:hypothetical protein